ncbi:hypothetical protein MRX33_09450 [Pseudomonas sp. JI-2]|nr:hypothetical protein [Pseudomonas sp. JI-2]
MGILVLEGKISELGNGAVMNGLTEYVFVNIGGKRVRRVITDLYLDSFVKVGAVVRLACAKSAGRLIVFAVQESNGEITKADLQPIIQKTFIGFLCGVFLGAFVGFFTYMLTRSISLSVGAYAAVIIGLPYFGSAGFFKARNALDGMAAPSEVATA